MTRDLGVTQLGGFPSAGVVLATWVYSGEAPDSSGSDLQPHVLEPSRGQKTTCAQGHLSLWRAVSSS